ncbi:hypothetical protein ABK040_009173 [Willaertia magna]
MSNITTTIPSVTNVTVSDQTVNEWNNLLDLKLKELLEDSSHQENDWKFHSEKSSIKIYTRNYENDSNTKFKGIGKLQTKKNVAEFIDYLRNIHLNLQKRKEHTKELMDCQLIDIEQLNENNENKQVVVEWWKVETPSVFVSNREYQVLTMFYKKSQDEGFMLNTSVENENFPKDSSLVRALCKISGWHVTKSKDKENELDVVFVFHGDTGGYIPAWIVNQACTSQPLVIDRYNQLLKQEENL